jgi:epoxyqueuosine reductase QueG
MLGCSVDGMNVRVVVASYMVLILGGFAGPRLVPDECLRSSDEHIYICICIHACTWNAFCICTTVNR